MNGHPLFFCATVRRQILATALVTGGALLSAEPPAHAAWEHAHGNSANTGFAMVDTQPAWPWWVQTQPLGAIAPGAGPVVGPNGEVYIGNLQGELRAFHADGTPYWTRELNRSHGGIFASPVVGADGSIYVVSSVRYTDHRDGVTNNRTDSYLHKFSPVGAPVFVMPFPEEFSDVPEAKNRGATTAPPNIWRSNGSEAIVVPVMYTRFNDTDPRFACG
jgi:hypothetical protein